MVPASAADTPATTYHRRRSAHRVPMASGRANASE